MHLHLIGGQLGGGADGIIISNLHVCQVDVPVVLPVIADHRVHLSHGVIGTLDATDAVGMVGTRREFRNV